jgi:hypothetical protein
LLHADAGGSPRAEAWVDRRGDRAARGQAARPLRTTRGEPGERPALEAGPSQPSTEEPAAQSQDHPGHESDLQQAADHGEESYRGSGKLEGRRALITGGDSGIGRAIAIAFAGRAPDVAIAYLPAEEEDAQETIQLIEEAGRKGLALPATSATRRTARSWSAGPSRSSAASTA